MSSALFWLVLTALATALMWMPPVLNRLAVRGLDRTSRQSEPHRPAARALGRTSARRSQERRRESGRSRPSHSGFASRHAQPRRHCRSCNGLFLGAHCALPDLHERHALLADAGVRRRLGGDDIGRDRFAGGFMGALESGLLRHSLSGNIGVSQ